MMKLGRIFVVHIDRALAVADGEFRFSTQIYRASHRAIRGADCGGVLAAAVEGEDTFADGIVIDGVGIRVCLDGAEEIERMDVEDCYILRKTIAGQGGSHCGS